MFSLETTANPIPPALDELVPSRYALKVGDIDVLVVSDGVLPLPTQMLGHNAEPAARAAWLEDMYLPQDAFDWALNVLVAQSGDRTILIDAGLGLDPDLQLPRAGQLIRRLEAAGIDLAKAMDGCNASIALDPEDANNYDSRGMVRLKMGDAAGAFADYDKAMTYGVEQASYLYGRGIAAIRLGHMVAGEADLARAAALDPGIAARYAKDGIQP